MPIGRIKLKSVFIVSVPGFFVLEPMFSSQKDQRGDKMIRKYDLCFVTLIVFTGLTGYSSFSQEGQPQGTRPVYKEPTSDFRQKSNDEIRAFLKSDSTNPADLSLRGRQRAYNEFLQMFLWFPTQAEVDPGDWFNGNLDLSGLQNLEWVIKTNKTIYQPGEPIGWRVSLRNISTEEVKILGSILDIGFILESMMIKKIRENQKQEVYLTKHGWQRCDLKAYRGKIMARSGRGLLKPGEMFQVDQPLRILNRYFDLSEPGEYELTFYTRDFLADDEHQIGEYPKPCTVRFKIEGNTNWLDSQVAWPEEEK